MAKTRPPATERVVSYVSPREGYWIIPSEKRDWCVSQTLLPEMTFNRAIRYVSPSGFHAAPIPDLI